MIEIGPVRSSPPVRRRTVGSVPVVVYGTRWCAQSQMVRRYLERLGVPYRYVDLETHPDAANRIAWLTGGEVAHPTVYIGGEILVQPTLRELEWALMQSGLR